MATREFILRFRAPAFLGELPSSEPRSITVIKRGREKTVSVPYYPIEPPGLRVPTLRGILELWYRALFGGADGRSIHRSQSEIFGSADRGQGLSIVPLAARFESQEIRFDRPSDLYPMLYMGYGPLQHVKYPSGRAAATSHNDVAFRDGVRVESQPWFRFLARGSSRQLAELDRALRLLHLFGGVGGRSRRGWGSVEIESEGIDRSSVASSEELGRWYEGQLEEAWRGIEPPSTVSGSPRHSAVHQGSRICLTPLRDSWLDVMLLFHGRFQLTRLYRPGPTPIAAADHALEAADATSPDPLSGAPERLAFGLPYAPESRQSGWRIEYVPTPVGTDPEVGASGRRASPLFLKIVRLANGKHVGVALFLGGEFFGQPGIQLGAVTGRDPSKVAKAGTVPFPGYHAVHEFLNDPSWQHVPLP